MGLVTGVPGVTLWFRRRYGASPWHLLGHLAAFASIGYALWAVVPGGGRARAVNLVEWLVAGAVLHDLVALPLYSLFDRGAQRAFARRHRRLLNHLRVPGAISLLLLLVYFPLIFVEADRNYLRATGRHVSGYAVSWLEITGGLFAGSLLLYAARSRRDDLEHSRSPAGDEHPPAPAVDGDRVGLADSREAP
jgi:hypothetical protein